MVRQRLIQISSVSAGRSARASSGLSTIRYEPGWIGCDGRRRRTERMEDLVVHRAVDVGAQAADLQLVRDTSCSRESGCLARGDADTIGVGVNSLDDQRPVGRDGGGATSGLWRLGGITGPLSAGVERGRGQGTPATARNSRRVGSRSCDGFRVLSEDSLRRARHGRPSGESRGRRSGTSTACDPGPAGAGSWRANRGRGPCRSTA